MRFLRWIYWEAETVGMIGYIIEQELENTLEHAYPVATLLTQVLVDGGEELGADALMRLTDVDGVYRDFRTDQQTRIEHLTPKEARALDLPAGSMGPKMTVAAAFAEHGSLAGIGCMNHTVDTLNKRAGTCLAAEMARSDVSQSALAKFER